MNDVTATRKVCPLVAAVIARASRHAATETAPVPAAPSQEWAARVPANSSVADAATKPRTRLPNEVIHVLTFQVDRSVVMATSFRPVLGVEERTSCWLPHYLAAQARPWFMRTMRLVTRAPATPPPPTDYLQAP